MAIEIGYTEGQTLDSYILGAYRLWIAARSNPMETALTLKRPIAQLLAATCFQFYVSIVDPSILAQPLGPAAPTPDPAAINTVAAPAVPATAAPAQGSQSTGTAGALQQGATQPTSP